MKVTTRNFKNKQYVVKSWNDNTGYLDITETNNPDRRIYEVMRHARKGRIPRNSSVPYGVPTDIQFIVYAQVN